MDYEALNTLLKEFGSKQTLQDLAFQELAKVVRPNKPLPSETFANQKLRREERQEFYAEKGIPTEDAKGMAEIAIQREIDSDIKEELKKFREGFLSLLTEEGVSPNDAVDMAYEWAFGDIWTLRDMLRKAA